MAEEELYVVRLRFWAKKATMAMIATRATKAGCSECLANVEESSRLHQCLRLWPGHRQDESRRESARATRAHGPTFVLKARENRGL